MSVPIGPCRHCGRRVPARAVCRACGYDADPERNRRDRFVWGLLGGLLVLSVVGAPIGLAFLLKATVHHRAINEQLVPGVEQQRAPSGRQDHERMGVPGRSFRGRGGS